MHRESMAAFRNSAELDDIAAGRGPLVANAATYQHLRSAVARTCSNPKAIRRLRNRSRSALMRHGTSFPDSPDNPSQSPGKLKAGYLPLMSRRFRRAATIAYLFGAASGHSKSNIMRASVLRQKLPHHVTREL
jgi:hypothetical protein